MKQNEQLYQIGVKGIIQNSENKILILKNRQKQFWDLPGGRVQEGENIIDTLMREIEEETGLKKFHSIKTLFMSLSNIKIPLDDYSIDSKNAHLIFYYHHCKLNLEQTILLSDEHMEFQWVNVGMARDLLTVVPPEIWDLKLLKSIQDISNEQISS